VLIFIASLPLLADPELVLAARAGNLAHVESLLASGADVNARDREGATALMFAALRGDEKLVRTLLAAGADPNLKDGIGETALILGARNAGIVGMLLEKDADPNLADAEGQTALLAAAEASPESVRLLVESGADVHHRDDFGVSALKIAETAGASEIAALLKAAGATATLTDRLHAAVREGHQAEVEELLAEGADPNGLDSDEFDTPLIAALRHRRLEILVVLLRAGADPTAQASGFFSDGDTALVVAAREGSPWALRTLLEAKSGPSDRDSALLAGCAHPPVVRVALEMGARVNAKGERGETALIRAAAAGSIESVALLLEAGADPRLKAADGSTALGRAIEGGHQEVVEALKRALER
jgi:ankyrin repeat protein